MLILAKKKYFTNANIAIPLQSCAFGFFCRLLAEEGLSVKVFSADEFWLASAIGFSDKLIILSAPFKTTKDLSFALEKNASIHVDSVNELCKLGTLAASKSKRYGVGISLSHLYREDKYSRFGVSKEEYIRDILPLFSRSEHLYLKGFHLNVSSYLKNPKKIMETLNDWLPFLVEHMPPSGYLEFNSNFPVGSFLFDSELEICNPEILFCSIYDMLSKYNPNLSERWKLIFELDYCLGEKNSYAVERVDNYKSYDNAQAIQSDLCITQTRFTHNRNHSLIWEDTFDKKPNQNEKILTNFLHPQVYYNLKADQIFLIRGCHPDDMQATNKWTCRKPPVYVWLKGSLLTARMPSSILANISRDLLHKEEYLYVDDNIRLETPSRKFASALYEAIDFNREYFSAFMAWPRFVTDENDTANFLDSCFLAHQKDEEKTYVILFNENPIGLLSFNSIDSGNKTGYIGYWLDRRAQGNGVITRAIKALVEHYSSLRIIKRFVIKCSVANPKSNAVAKRCGFVLEGTLRQAEYLNGIFHDQNIYSWISSDT
ncbi:Ribosomal-protein-serine acetyltransferase [Candidatus Bartonella washoeensis]|uniref:N-acetyltransferase domain-containing protein n=1 Tax=Candidatus Bartonella washoeensis Sb944nv TaxID=1094563 RepID=J1J6I4_9HYPH|nr:50S ribosomal protein L7/L12-serine acetyltransferase [Bartonella washoeensis]EJF79375.1 hypothetical protein MCQ_00916 [Bartonella washoeensis Sb944nv]SPU27497.1 Ribosomal-protein-serine acetyltransferase [Bartonella washoeensis]